MILVQRSIRQILLISLCITLTACGGLRDKNKQEVIKPALVSNISENTNISENWRTRTFKNKANIANFNPIIEDESIFMSDTDGKIEGFSTIDGRREFKFNLKTPLASGVGVSISTVYTVDRKGMVTAIDRDDNSVKWQYSVGRVISAPPVLNEKILVVRTIDGQLLGIDVTTGEQAWGFERSVASLSIGLDAPVLIAAEGVISGFSSGRVLASNVYNGKLFWEKRAFRPNGKNDIERLIDIDAQPVLSDRSVIMSAYQGALVAYRLIDGERIWRNDDLITRKRIGVGDKALYITQPQSNIAAIDASTGKLLWQNNQLRGHRISAPIAVDDVVIVGTQDADVYFLDAKTGEIVNKSSLSMSAITDLYKVKDTIIAYSSKSGTLVSFTL